MDFFARHTAVFTSLAIGLLAPAASQSASVPTGGNSEPTAPTITLPDKVYAGDFIVPIVWGSTDPDGDEIDTYEISWMIIPGVPVPPSVIHNGPWLAPSLAGDGRRFQVSARAIDARGLPGPAVSREFTLLEGLPTAPELQIWPEAPPTGYSLGIQYTKESTDPDRDVVRYRLEWWKASAEGQPFVRVAELDNLTTVPGNMVVAGNVWKVISYPYQRVGSPDGTVEHPEGTPGSDTVTISGAANQPPTVSIDGLEFHQAASGPSTLQVGWTSADPEGGKITATLSVVTSTGGTAVFTTEQELGSGGGREIQFQADPEVAYTMRIVARDEAGATVEVNRAIPGTGGGPLGFVVH